MTWDKVGSVSVEKRGAESVIHVAATDGRSWELATKDAQKADHCANQLRDRKDALGR